MSSFVWFTGPCTCETKHEVQLTKEEADSYYQGTTFLEALVKRVNSRIAVLYAEVKQAPVVIPYPGPVVVDSSFPKYVNLKGDT